MKARRTRLFQLFLLISSAFFYFSPSAQAQDTIQVISGWNMIGSVKAGAVPDVLFTDPPGIITTDFFGYVPGAGYETNDMLQRGLGYWVKVSSDGIIVFNTPTPQDCGRKLVTYGGRLYHTVQIADQCWIDENMNVGTMIDEEIAQTDNATLEKWCWSNNPLYCSLYGGLYSWEEAMQYTTTPGAQGICPPGWHIPTTSEFETLSSAVGGNSNALKALGQGTGAGTGTNTSAFSALLAGKWYPGFLYLGTFGYIWTSDEGTPPNAYVARLYSTNSDIIFEGYDNQIYGYSVRCLED